MNKGNIWNNVQLHLESESLFTFSDLLNKIKHVNVNECQPCVLAEHLHDYYISELMGVISFMKLKMTRQKQ